jgi:hypothetical protein
VKKKRKKNWSIEYRNSILRNIGFLSIEEQEKLRESKIVVFGVGGIGGPLAEQIVRAGCENLVICDNDIYEESNLNRQICTREDLGKKKVDVIQKLLNKINPNIQIKKFFEINSRNIYEIINNATVVALTLDDPIISILIARNSYEKDIPLIESWALPYLWAWWFTRKNPIYESIYGFDTQNLTIKQICESNTKLKEIRKHLLMKLTQFPGIKETFSRVDGTLEKMISGEIPLISIAPCVRITASYLAFEIIYSGIINFKDKILAPRILGFDYFRMKCIDLSIV